MQWAMSGAAYCMQCPGGGGGGGGALLSGYVLQALVAGLAAHVLD